MSSSSAPPSLLRRVLESRLIVHAVALAGATFGLALAKVAVSAFVAHTYGPLEYGVFATAFAYVQLVAVLFDLGLADWALLCASRAGAHALPKRKVLRLYGVATVVFGGLGYFLASAFVRDPAARQLVGWLLLTVWAYAGQSLMQAILRANFRVTAAARLRLLQVVINILALGVAWTASLDLPQMLAVVAAGELLLLALFIVLVARQPAGVTAEAGVRTRDLAPFAISTVAAYAYITSDAFILSQFRSAVEVGQYTAGYRVYLLGLQGVGLVIGALLPLLYSIDDPEERRDVFARVTDVQGAIVLASCAVGLASASLVTRFIYGSGFEVATIVLACLMISLALRGIGLIPAYLLTAGGWQSRRTFAQVVVAVLNVGANLVLIPRFGIWAALATTICCDVVLMTIYCGLAMRVPGSSLSPAVIRHFTLTVLLVGVLCFVQLYYDSPLLTFGVGLVAAAWALRQLRSSAPQLARQFAHREGAALRPLLTDERSLNAADARLVEPTADPPRPSFSAAS
jgi:O-antigen/teichoic acid export membrane protein